MATTVVSNLAVYSDQTGHGNQSHLVYAVNQQRWWLFVIKSKTATVVSTYVSSSNNLTTATWSASTDSPVFPSSHTPSSVNHRNLGVLYFVIGTTDAAHISVGFADVSNVAYGEHIRCTFTGTSSISWDASWNEVSNLASAPPGSVIGNNLAVGSTGFIHEAAQYLSNASNPQARISSNADTTASWTNGFGSTRSIDLSTYESIAYALASLGAGAMLCVYDTGSSLNTNCTGLRFNKYTSGTTWPTTGGADVGIGTSTQDVNDWCLCAVDTTHIYTFRRDSSNTYLWRVYNGSSWSSPSNSVPNQNSLAGGGMFAATDGTDLYLFVLDSATNNPVQYVKCSGANGSSPSWGTWTQLEAAGSTARNSISGYPVVANKQIGVVYTQVNGSNYDIVLSVLSLVQNLSLTLADTPSTSDSTARTLAALRSLPDTPSTSDSTTRTLTALRSIPDAPSSLDVVTVTSTQPRTLADTPSSADSISRTLAAQRTLADTPSSNDAINRVLSGTRTVTDTPSTADSLSRTLIANRSLSDSSASSDDITRLLQANRTLADTPATTDSIDRLVVLSVTLTDTTSTTDAVSRLLGIDRTLADAPTSSDLVGVVTAQSRTMTDTPTSADVLAANSNQYRDLVDGPAMSDGTVRILSGSRSLTDEPTTDDSATGSKTNIRDLTDAPSSLDSIARLLAASRVITDSPALVDSIARITTNYRTLGDTPQTSDVFMGYRGYILTINDTVISSDSMTQTLTATRTVGDAPTTSDVVGRTLSSQRGLNDVLTTSDTTHIGRMIIGLLTDNLSLSDGVVRTLSLVRHLADTPFTAESITIHPPSIPPITAFTLDFAHVRSMELAFIRTVQFILDFSHVRTFTLDF